MFQRAVRRAAVLPTMYEELVRFYEQESQVTRAQDRAALRAESGDADAGADGSDSLVDDRACFSSADFAPFQRRLQRIVRDWGSYLKERPEILTVAQYRAKRAREREEESSAMDDQ